MRAEDPWLFKNELGYHIVFHQYNQSDTVTGGHLFSTDARSWNAQMLILRFFFKKTVRNFKGK